MSDDTGVDASAAAELAMRRRATMYIAPVGLLTVASLIGAASMPWLSQHAPLALIALSPLFRHFVLVTPKVDAWSFFVVGVPRHFAPDPFVYMLGREYGQLAVEWMESNSPHVGRLVRGLERLFSKVGVFALLVYPDVTMSTLAGVARVPIPLFVAFNIIGTIGTLFVARWFGVAFQAEILRLLAFFQEHLFAATAASILFVLALNHWSRRSGARSD